MRRCVAVLQQIAAHRADRPPRSAHGWLSGQVAVGQALSLQQFALTSALSTVRLPSDVLEPTDDPALPSEQLLAKDALEEEDAGLAPQEPAAAVEAAQHWRPWNDQGSAPRGDTISRQSPGSASSSSSAAGSFKQRLQVPPLDLSAYEGMGGVGLEAGEALRTTCSFAGRQLTLETGRLARMADGACLGAVGGTQVLVTVVADRGYRDDRDSLPLTVDYREWLYAVGRIPGSYTRREGVPKDRELLGGRTIDRALRPLFPPGFHYETTVVASVISSDGEQDTDVLAINTASAALMCSNIPWEGPVGAVRMALCGGRWVANATAAARADADASFLYAGTADKALALEVQGNEVSEEMLAEGLQAAHEAVQQAIAGQQALAQRAMREKRQVKLWQADPAAARNVVDACSEAVEKVLRCSNLGKAGRSAALADIRTRLLQGLRDKGYFRMPMMRVPGSGCVSPTDVAITLEALKSSLLRQLALEEGLRVDGRGLVDLRPITAQTHAVPVVHGSCLFQRGETQSLCTVTVGGSETQQQVEGMRGISSKRLIVHYTFPAFAINQASMRGGNYPARREVGHSALVERALQPLMQEPDVQPFTLRLNAETLASNGSSSMAAVCGCCLALADAGLPLRALVAGVSVGLLDGGRDPLHDLLGGNSRGEDSAAVAGGMGGGRELLTDLQGIEDALGDMDFKVAGTSKGITAAQLDVKQGGVPRDVLPEALRRARMARLQVLDTMADALPAQRLTDAPRFGSIDVEPAVVGRIIGPMGSTIRRIKEDTGALLELKNGGSLQIFAPSEDAYEAVVQTVANLGGSNIRQGERYSVRVAKLMDYGAFVEFDTGMQALLHISEIAHTKIRAVEDVLALGDTVEVLCMGRDTRGNIKISARALQAQQAAER